MTFDMIFEAKVVAVTVVGAEPRVVPVIWAAKNREG